MSSVKFANALVQNLSIFDGTGFDRRGYYAERFLSALAENDDELIESVCEYNVEIRGIINRGVVRPVPIMKANHPYMRANRLVNLTDDWIDGVNREVTEAKLIAFLK